MKIAKAVITCAARSQRTLALHTIVDRDGKRKPLLCILVGEAIRAGIEQVCIVVCPGDEPEYLEAAQGYADRLRFARQEAELGYGHAIHCAGDFVGGEPFLHLIGDHLFVSNRPRSCVEQVMDAAQTHECSVSGVQATREGLLPYFGAVGGQRVSGTQDLYTIERVLEKPSPTAAEQTLAVPGLRAGHYLCFSGIHVLTPAVMELLREAVAAHPGGPIELSPVLAELAARERYLALEVSGSRYALDGSYGLLAAQLGLALSGKDREEVLMLLCELLAARELVSGR